MQAVSEKTGAGATSEDGAVAELLLFRLGRDGRGGPGELFAIRVSSVREIVEMPSVTALAGAQAPLLGMVSLRGDIIHVLDLPAMAGCVAAHLDIMLVTEFGGAVQGFAVESVEEIVVLPNERLTGAMGRVARLDGGDGPPLLAQVLDIEALLEGLTA